MHLWAVTSLFQGNGCKQNTHPTAGTLEGKLSEPLKIKIMNKTFVFSWHNIVITVWNGQAAVCSKLLLPVISIKCVCVFFLNHHTAIRSSFISNMISMCHKCPHQGPIPTSVVRWNASVSFLNCFMKILKSFSWLSTLLTEWKVSFSSSAATSTMSMRCCTWAGCNFKPASSVLTAHFPSSFAGHLVEIRSQMCSARSCAIWLQKKKIHLTSKCKVGHSQIQMSPTIFFFFLPVLHNTLNLPGRKNKTTRNIWHTFSLNYAKRKITDHFSSFQRIWREEEKRIKAEDWVGISEAPKR